MENLKQELQIKNLEETVLHLQDTVCKMLEMQGQITDLITSLHKICESHTASIQTVADILSRGKSVSGEKEETVQ